jgi:hypothetical protein
MTEPSPVAQAVLDAFWGDKEYIADSGDINKHIAAALRAAADHVVPERDCPDTEEWLGQSAWAQAESGVRLRLLAIAAELAGEPTPNEND